MHMYIQKLHPNILTRCDERLVTHLLVRVVEEGDRVTIVGSHDFRDVEREDDRVLLSIVAFCHLHAQHIDPETCVLSLEFNDIANGDWKLDTCKYMCIFVNI